MLFKRFCIFRNNKVTNIKVVGKWFKLEYDVQSWEVENDWVGKQIAGKRENFLELQQIKHLFKVSHFTGLFKNIICEHVCALKEEKNTETTRMRRVREMRELVSRIPVT